MIFMERQIEIGGMTYDSYDSENDPTGAIGLALADAKDRQNRVACGESPCIARLARIALSRFSELQSGERISVREIKKRLSEIRQAGYNVEPYGNMSKKEAWNYLLKIRREIREKVRDSAPGTLEMIGKTNAEQRRAAIYDLR